MIWSAERLISESFNGVCEGIEFDFVSGLDVNFFWETLVPSGQNNTPRGRCFVAERTGGEATFFTIGWKDLGGVISGTSLLGVRLFLGGATRRGAARRPLDCVQPGAAVLHAAVWDVHDALQPGR